MPSVVGTACGRVDVSIPTIKRLEAQSGDLGGRDYTAGKIISALEAAGVEFTNGRGQASEGVAAARVRGTKGMKTVVISGAVLVGLFFVGLAALYWLNPADHLPAFVPGYDPQSDKRHFTHGLGMLVIGLMAFALAALRGWGD